MHFKITSNCHLSGGMVVSIITITLLQISKLLLSSDLKSSRHGKNVKSIVGGLPGPAPLLGGGRGHLRRHLVDRSGHHADLVSVPWLPPGQGHRDGRVHLEQGARSALHGHGSGGAPRGRRRRGRAASPRIREGDGVWSQPGLAQGTVSERGLATGVRAVGGAPQARRGDPLRRGPGHRLARLAGGSGARRPCGGRGRPREGRARRGLNRSPSRAKPPRIEPNAIAQRDRVRGRARLMIPSSRAKK